MTAAMAILNDFPAAQRRRWKARRSAARLDVAAVSETGAFVSISLPNGRIGLSDLVRWLGRHGAGFVVLEAAGGIERAAATAPFPADGPSAPPNASA